MPVPQLPLELIQLIVADPTLTKADLQWLCLTARAFPPLVRPHLFRRLEIPLGWFSEDSAFPNPDDYGPAITLDEMDRLMSLRRRGDLAGLVKEVRIDQRWGLKPPPGCIRMTAHDSMQLVYAIFPRLEQAAASTDWLPQFATTPPREPLPCCEVLHTLHYLRLDAHTWKGLQMCPALRHLSIAEMSLDKGVPAASASASLSLRLETLDFDWLWQNKTGNVFLQRILHACGPSLKHLNLGVIWGDVRDLSILSNLLSLTIGMRSGDEADETEEFGETMDAWLAEVLPTCAALERLTINTAYIGGQLTGNSRPPQRLLAEPEVAAALPATLKRIDFNMALEEGELEAVLSNQSSVQVLPHASKATTARRRFIASPLASGLSSSAHPPHTPIERGPSNSMPVAQLPLELIKPIVTDPTLTKADLQWLCLTARVFPPLVRPHLFERLKILIGPKFEDKKRPRASKEPGDAITLDEMDRLMSLRRRGDLAELVKEVCIGKGHALKPPPGSIRMTAHDLMQLVYTIFPRLEKATATTSSLPELAIARPREPLPCCEVLHTLHYLRLDAHTWKGLQMCPALRHLSIAEMSLRKGVPAVSPSLPLRLETLDFGWCWENDTGNVFLQPILYACGPTLKHLRLSMIWDTVTNLAMLPNLASLTVYMKSDDEVEEIGETLDAWLAEVLPTCTALERLNIDTPDQVGYKLRRSPQRLLAEPEVAAALPATLKRIDFNMALEEGELEAVLSNQSSVQVISAYLMPDSSWDFCRKRGIKVVDSYMSKWPA